VTLRRLGLMPVLAVLAVLCLVAPAGAHPGHDAADGFHAASPPNDASAWPPLRHHGPAAAALLVAAGSILASVPHRRRVLALTVVLLLSMVSLEGVLHAALHLHHVRHAGSLAIGASPAQLPAVGPDPEAPSASPVVLIGGIVGHADRIVASVVLASSRGRAPPAQASLSLAS